MAGLPKKRFWTGPTTELVSIIGLRKELQVSSHLRTWLLEQDIYKIGRGVLIDYASWAEKRGIKYTTFSQHTIKLVEMLEIAKECNITFQRGDILLVRIGVIKEWEHEMDVAAKQAYAVSTSPKHAGVEGTMEVLKWVWNTGFAAVAGDAISWEVSPCRLDLLVFR
jgi:hypothetical protein